MFRSHRTIPDLCNTSHSAHEPFFDHSSGGHQRGRTGASPQEGLGKKHSASRIAHSSLWHPHATQPQVQQFIIELFVPLRYRQKDAWLVRPGPFGNFPCIAGTRRLPTEISHPGSEVAWLHVSGSDSQAVSLCAVFRRVGQPRLTGTCQQLTFYYKECLVPLSLSPLALAFQRRAGL